MVRKHQRWHTEDGPVTVLVEFTLTQPENTASVASTLADAIAQNLSGRLGFLACTMMASTDSRRLITITRWASQDAWLATAHRPDSHTIVEDGIHWLQCPDSDTTLTTRLAGTGATLHRVEVLHEVQTLTTLVPHPAAVCRDEI